MGDDPSRRYAGCNAHAGAVLSLLRVRRSRFLNTYGIADGRRMHPWVFHEALTEVDRGFRFAAGIGRRTELAPFGVSAGSVSRSARKIPWFIWLIAAGFALPK